MHPVAILSIAISIVLVGILVFRLHAFLALLLAALTVALLTPARVVELAEVKSRARTVRTVEETDEGALVSWTVAKDLGSQAGMEFVVLPAVITAQTEHPRVVLDRIEEIQRDGKRTKRAIARLLAGSPLPKVGDLVIHELEWKAARSTAGALAPVRVSDGFGRTCGSIGILIAMASIIGKCLLDSGAADRIVRFTLSLVGQARAPLAFLGSGFLLGIPVFFDTVFYLMIPLGKAMRLRTGGNYLLYILTIVAGGSMAHSLVPPTPGPLYVADQMGIDIMTMICAGCLVGLVCSVAGYLTASFLNRRMDIPLRPSADISLEELQQLADRPNEELPPTWLAVLPIVLPVLLIAAQTALRSYLDGLPVGERPEWLLAWKPLVDTLGNKNVALILAGAIALGMLAWQKRSSTKELGIAVQSALAGGGVIILITSAGGAFGATVRQCGISEEIAQLTEGLNPVWILPIAFLVTTLIRTAQGSATVAMITAVGVLQNLATSDTLPFHPVYLALAIGCGSKPVAWMADSGFWVICKMSGMTEAEGLKTVTPLSIVMGITGLLTTMAGAALLPLK